jgi:hypothetical protein
MRMIVMMMMMMTMMMMIKMRYDDTEDDDGDDGSGQVNDVDKDRMISRTIVIMTKTRRLVSIATMMAMPIRIYSDA